MDEPVMQNHTPENCPFTRDQEYARKNIGSGIPGRSPVTRFDFDGYVDSTLCPICKIPFLFDAEAILLFEKWIAGQLLNQLTLTSRELRFLRRVAGVKRQEIPEEFKAVVLCFERENLGGAIELLSYLDFLNKKLGKSATSEKMFDLSN
jgi:hypothetical protein